MSSVYSLLATCMLQCWETKSFLTLRHPGFSAKLFPPFRLKNLTSYPALVMNRHQYCPLMNSDVFLWRFTPPTQFALRTKSQRQTCRGFVEALMTWNDSDVSDTPLWQLFSLWQPLATMKNRVTVGHITRGYKKRCVQRTAAQFISVAQRARHAAILYFDFVKFTSCLSL